MSFTYTDKAQKALDLAGKISKKLKHYYIKLYIKNFFCIYTTNHSILLQINRLSREYKKEQKSVLLLKPGSFIIYTALGLFPDLSKSPISFPPHPCNNQESFEPFPQAFL